MSARKSLWTSMLGGMALCGSAANLCAQDRPAAQAVPASPAAAPKQVKTLAVVNGELITTADLELALKQAGPSPVALTEDQTKQMKMEMFRMLMDAALMRQFLTKYAPAASDNDIAQKLAEMEEGLKKQGKTLADYLRETSQTEASVRTNLGFGCQWEHFAQGHVTEAELQRYYTEYKEYFDGVTVRASHIVLRVPPNATAEDVAATKAKLNALRTELIDKKADFAEAAKAYSQCPSKENGGDIGYIPRRWGMVDEAFARTAFGTAPGQISEVVQTDYGLHVIKVTDRKAGQASDYTKIKADVRQYYIEDMRQSLLQQQRQASKIQVDLAPLQ